MSEPSLPSKAARRAARGDATARSWLDMLPRLLDETLKAWSLRVERVIPGAYSFVADVQRADGADAVLKIAYPERESDDEAEGLRRWSGRGAVGLLAHDRDRGALLLERVVPGSSLAALDVASADAAAVAMLPRVWTAPSSTHPFERVDLLAREWADDLPRLAAGARGACEPPLLEVAVTAFRDLGPAQKRSALLHRDFHGGNVLRSHQGWRFIDPKPVVGEPEFDVAWYVGDRPSEMTRELAARRLDFVSAGLDLDRGRIRRWAVARYVLGGLWSYEDGSDGSGALSVARQFADLPR